jgi:hypothetical protein
LSEGLGAVIKELLRRQAVAPRGAPRGRVLGWGSSLGRSAWARRRTRFRQRRPAVTASGAARLGPPSPLEDAGAKTVLTTGPQVRRRCRAAGFQARVARATSLPASCDHEHDAVPGPSFPFATTQPGSWQSTTRSVPQPSLSRVSAHPCPWQSTTRSVPQPSLSRVSAHPCPWQSTTRSVPLPSPRVA